MFIEFDRLAEAVLFLVAFLIMSMAWYLMFSLLEVSGSFIILLDLLVVLPSSVSNMTAL